MKRFWHKCLALIAVAMMTGTASAQWNQQPEIGSYQSILSRAGYQQQNMNGGMHSNMPAQSMAPATQMSPTNLPGMQGHSMPAASSQPMMTGTMMGQPGCPTGSVGPIVGSSGSMMSHAGSMPGSVGPMVGSPMINGGCATGNCGTGSGMVDYTDYGAAGMGAGIGCGPVYSPGANLGAGFAGRNGLRGGGGNVNRVGSLFGVVLTRNYEDDVRLAYNGAGTEIFSGDIDQGNMSGLGASLINRNCNGSGWEFVYWGVDDDIDVSLPGPTFTNLGGLANLDHVPSGFNMWDVFNNGTDARFYRDTEINSIAFNLLRNGGQYTTRRGQSANFELLGGFRMFQFDESFRYVSNSTAPYPLTSDYQLQAENLLVGLQFGGRNEICLSNRLRLATAATVGLFNNHVETRQRIIDETGYSPLLAGGPSAGRPFDYSDEKDDVAVMGEFNLGLIYQLSSKMRARVGYQVMGVSGVALAVDQIPFDFNDSYLLQQAQSNGSLIMHGVYFGSEFCF